MPDAWIDRDGACQTWIRKALQHGDWSVALFVDLSTALKCWEELDQLDQSPIVLASMRIYHSCNQTKHVATVCRPQEISLETQRQCTKGVWIGSSKVLTGEHRWFNMNYQAVGTPENQPWKSRTRHDVMFQVFPLSVWKCRLNAAKRSALTETWCVKSATWIAQHKMQVGGK